MTACEHQPLTFSSSSWPPPLTRADRAPARMWEPMEGVVKVASKNPRRLAPTSEPSSTRAPMFLAMARTSSRRSARTCPPHVAHASTDTSAGSRNSVTTSVQHRWTEATVVERRFSFVTIVLVIAMGVVACGNGDGRSTIKDTAGRTCEASLLDVTCDQEPMPAPACGAGETAGFILVPFGGSARSPASVCPACKRADTGFASGQSCAAVTCTRDFDCPDAYPICQNGRCFARQ
jgi:hypothetical protein